MYTHGTTDTHTTNAHTYIHTYFMFSQASTLNPPNVLSFRLSSYLHHVQNGTEGRASSDADPDHVVLPFLQAH